MPTENDFGDRVDNARRGGLIRNAISIASPFYAFSTLGMLSKMPTEGVHVPWTPFTIWRPPQRTAMIAERFTQRRYGIGKFAVRRGVTRIGPSTRSVARTIYSGKLAAERAAGRTINAASRVALKGSARMAAQGMAARYLVGATASAAVKFMGAFDAVAIPAMIGIGLYNFASSKVSQYKGLELGGYFNDSAGAQTSRQRAVQAITASQLQARSAIGNEAMLFHR